MASMRSSGPVRQPGKQSFGSKMTVEMPVVQSECHLARLWSCYCSLRISLIEAAFRLCLMGNSGIEAEDSDIVDKQRHASISFCLQNIDRNWNVVSRLRFCQTRRKEVVSALAVQ